MLLSVLDSAHFRQYAERTLPAGSPVTFATLGESTGFLSLCSVLENYALDVLLPSRRFFPADYCSWALTADTQRNFLPYLEDLLLAKGVLGDGRLGRELLFFLFALLCFVCYHILIEVCVR